MTDLVEQLKVKLLNELNLNYGTFMSTIKMLDNQFSPDAIRFFNVGFMCYREAINLLKVLPPTPPVNDTNSTQEAA